MNPQQVGALMRNIEDFKVEHRRRCQRCAEFSTVETFREEAEYAIHLSEVHNDGSSCEEGCNKPRIPQGQEGTYLRNLDNKFTETLRNVTDLHRRRALFFADELEHSEEFALVSELLGGNVIALLNITNAIQAAMRCARGVAL